MSRSKSFASNAFWSLILQLVSVLTSFLVPRTIIGSYGSEANGLVTSLTQMIGYLSLVEAGVSAAAVFSLYEPLRSKDSYRISAIVSTAKRFYYKSGITFVLLSLLLAIVYPRVVDCAGFDAKQIALLTLSLCASGVLDFFTLAKYRVLLTADQKNWVIQIATIGYKILYTGIVLLLAGLRVDLVLVYLVAIIPVILRTIFLSIYAKRSYPNIDFNMNASNSKIDQQWDAFILQILSVVQSSFPILAVTFFVDSLDYVSVFSVYLLVANGIQQLCGVVTNGTQAVFGEVIAGHDLPLLRKAYRELCVLMGVLNTVTSGVAIVLITPFVSLYVAGQADINYSYPILGILVIINAFLYQLKAPEGLLVIAAGKYRESKPYVFAQSLILVVGSSIGALTAGMCGVMIGVCLSNVFAAIYLVVLVSRQITRTSCGLTLARYAISLFAFAPAVAAAAFQLLHPTDWFSWVSDLALSVVLCVAWALLVFYLFDKKATRALFKRFASLIAI